MRNKKRRGMKKMYYISDNEYILFPLHISNKIQYYFSRKNSRNQLICTNFIEKKKRCKGYG